MAETLSHRCFTVVMACDVTGFMRDEERAIHGHHAIPQIIPTYHHAVSESKIRVDCSSQPL